MKRLIITISILLSFLVFAFFQTKKQQDNHAKQQVIGILQLLTHPALDDIHKGIVAGLRQKGFVNGKNIKIDYQNAQGDQSNLKSMSERFVDEHAKITVGIATPAVQSLAHATSTIPVIMGAVSDPIGSGLVSNLKHPGKNITGVQHIEPIRQQVKMIKEFFPNIKVMGVMYTSSDDSSAAEFREFKKLAKKEDITVKAFTITSTNDIDQVSQTMASQVQAVFLPTDNTVASGVQSILKNTNAAKIPVFSAEETMVKAGGIATYSVSQYDIGILTGKMMARILKGEKPANMPIEHVSKGKYTINKKACDLLGVKIPENILTSAQKKGVVIK